MASIRSLHARLAITSRHHGPDCPEALEIRRNLNMAIATDRITQVLQRQPRLTPDQLNQLATLVTESGSAT